MFGEYRLVPEALVRGRKKSTLIRADALTAREERRANAPRHLDANQKLLPALAFGQEPVGRLQEKQAPLSAAPCWAKKKEEIYLSRVPVAPSSRREATARVARTLEGTPATAP